jgi:hypothetical protein
VRFPIRKPDEAQSNVLENSLTSATLRVAVLPAQTSEDGQRVANAVKHAAQLCNSESSVF